MISSNAYGSLAPIDSDAQRSLNLNSAQDHNSTVTPDEDGDYVIFTDAEQLWLSNGYLGTLEDEPTQSLVSNNESFSST